MTSYLNFATTAWPRRPAALTAFNEACAALPQDVRHSSVSDRDEARRRVAARLGAGPEDVYFSADATTALNCVVNGVTDEFRRSGGQPAVVVDNRSHNAVLRPAHRAAGERCTVLPLHAIDDTYDDSALYRLPAAVDLMVLTHTSNVHGSVYDVARAVADIRRTHPGTPVLVDASQSAGATDLAPALTADFVVFPGHKHLAAPPGAAVLVASRFLPDWLTGGTGTSTLDLSMPARDGRSHVEVGSGNAPAETALATAMEEDTDAARKAVAQHVEQLWEGLSGIRGVRLLGRPPGGARTGLVAMAPKFGTPEEWAIGLRQHGVVARGGLQCAPVHHRQLGLTRGSVRFSPGWATTKEDIDLVVAACGELAGALEAVHA